MFKKLKNLIYQRAYIAPDVADNIVERFHKLYYDSFIFGKTWRDTHWLGTPILKCPMDLCLYQEIIHELKPDLIIETGTAKGGSALFLSSMCDLVKNGKVVSIDVLDDPGRPKHERLTYLHGSSTSDDIVGKVKEMAKDAATLLVFLDSDHSKKHVLEEMKIYSRMVTKGSYMVVEDSNINGHPVDPDFGPGPMEAMEEYLANNNDFVIDKDKEKFYLTFNPKGYLKKR